MVDTFYNGHDELYHHAKFGGDRTTRAGCRCENVVFVTMFLCHATSPMSRAFEGCILRISIALSFDLDAVFSIFFPQLIALSDVLHSSYIRR